MMNPERNSRIGGHKPISKDCFISVKNNPKGSRMGVCNFASLKRMFTPIFILTPSLSSLLVIKHSFKETFRNPFYLVKIKDKTKMNYKMLLKQQQAKNMFFVQQMCKFAVNNNTILCGGEQKSYMFSRALRSVIIVSL